MDYLCILCPRGCTLRAQQAGDGAVTVQGNGCERGIRYATEELICPRRLVTTTIPLAGASGERLPVRTRDPVPKDCVFPVLSAIRSEAEARRISGPLAMGDIIITNVFNTGTDVIASENV